MFIVSPPPYSYEEYPVGITNVNKSLLFKAISSAGMSEKGAKPEVFNIFINISQRSRELKSKVSGLVARELSRSIAVEKAARIPMVASISSQKRHMVLAVPLTLFASFLPENRDSVHR